MRKYSIRVVIFIFVAIIIFSYSDALFRNNPFCNKIAFAENHNKILESPWKLKKYLERFGGNRQQREWLKFKGQRVIWKAQHIYLWLRGSPVIYDEGINLTLSHDLRAYGKYGFSLINIYILENQKKIRFLI